MLNSEQEWDDVKGSIGKIAMPYSAPDILETMDALIELARAVDRQERTSPGSLSSRTVNVLDRLPRWIKRKESSGG